MRSIQTLLILAACSCLSNPPMLSAQNARPPAPKSSPSRPASAESKSQQSLPVRQVILYKNGIGYFEHSGQVLNNQHVAIDFTSSQLNDVLQSLTILDENGGRIGGVNYNSTTPLAEQLKSLSLAMSDDPSSTELLQALRGQRVEITGAPGGIITGRLMSIETKTEKSPTGDAIIEKSYLTIIASGSAVRVIELTPTLSVRPLDPSLQSQLDRFLELLSSTHSTGLRHLTLDALGQGQRQLRVSYISEVPVWKSTYRLVFPKDATDSATLQGWAVVDNTIGSDWDNVQLSLVAGAPQSFIQPLSQPLYLRRPEVPISTTAQTTPQTHEAADMPEPPIPVMKAGAPMTSSSNGPMLGNQMKMRSLSSSQSVTVSAGVAGMEGSGSAGGVIGGLFGSSGAGLGSGMGGNMGGGIYRASDAVTEGDVSTNKFDDFFEYKLAQPVTIHKNESAMVPILQEKLPAERVTLWSPSEATPFRAVWLENTSKLTFDRGSFSIFESGLFAGQGLLDPIHPGEKRLLSYAADQAIHVRLHPEESKTELRKIHLAPRGYLHITYGAASKTTYTASNSAEEARTVILEVPRQANRDLSTAADAGKPAETTPSLYRFKLAVPAHQSASILVSDTGPEYNDWFIDPNNDQSEILQKLVEEAPATADRFNPIIAAEKAMTETRNQLADLEQKRQELTTEEARSRENLTALKGNDGARRFVDELNRTEDALETNRQQTEALKTRQKSAEEALRQSLQTLTLDWSATN